jgi:hypothetical protein
LFDTAEAYDSLDPNGNITIKWDIISWTPDGYVVSSTPFTSTAVCISTQPISPWFFTE